ncbi:LysM peptidoglycan-binding domain-containing protein [Paenibacillus ferrarius]|uniref:LysM peptidoglycan-binding domain-containing protein n=1 Tax=Paenibacillus ferrarius TaxID=1469647 RepID=UPI003D2957BE
MAYEIHLSYNNNQEGFQLPVNPESIEVSRGGNSKIYDIVGPNDGKSEVRGGEVNVIKGPKLREISFDGLFPAQYYPFVTTSVVYEPMYYVRAIENWMATKRPIRFIYTGHYSDRLASQNFSAQELNLPVSIEKFEWKEEAGGSGDIEFSLSLKEYVFYGIRKVSIVSDGVGRAAAIPQAARRPDERVRPSTHTWTAGDSMTKVAMRYYETDAGKPDSSRSKDIQTMNGLTNAQVAKLKVGSVLKLPVM